jgi:polyribonucleotide nucleotidyltransferase
VQVVIHVVSLNLKLKATSLLIASGALAISGIPFNGPIGAARVSIDGQYVLNPGKTQLKDSKWTWLWPVPKPLC